VATPPTRVTYATPAVGYGNTSTPKTTPTFDVVSGDLLTVIGSSENESVTLNTPTATGGSVTWTLRQSIVVTDYCSMYVWTGAVGATATGITVSVARATGSSQWSFGVTVWRNHGGVGSSAKTNVSSGAPSLAISCSDNSALVVGCDDWNAVDGTSRTWRTVNGSAITESLYFRNSATYTVYSGYRSDTGSAGTQTVGLSAPTGQKYSIAAVEVLGTSSGPDPKSGADAAAAAEGVTSITGTASRTDTGAVAEGSTALTAAATVTGSAALSEAVGLAQLVTDAGSVSETTGLSVALAATDAGSLADSGALVDQRSVSDTAALAESVSITASASGADTGTLTESADADGGTTEYRFPSGAGLTPTGTHDDTPSTLNLGTVFTLTAASDIDGVALYATAATTFTAQLWADGVKVAEKTGISHAGTGWVVGLFDTPYSGTTGVDYIVSALQDTGTTKYSSRTLTFSDGTNPVLVEVGPVRSNTTNNGLYTYGIGIPATASGTNGVWFGVDAVVAASVPSGPGPVTDGSTLTDSVELTVALAIGDSGSLTETAAAAQSASDSGALSDVSTVVATATVTDSVVLTDTASLNSGSNQSVVDSGALTDSQALAAALTRTDTVALTDAAVVSVPKSGTDTGVLAEQSDALITDTDPDATLSESVALAALMSRSDTGTVTDTASVSASGNPSASDTGALVETAAIVVVITTTDSAVAADGGTLTAIVTREDGGAFTDASAVTIAGVAITAVDIATAGETATISVTVAATDSGTSTAAYALAGMLASTDAAIMTDAATASTETDPTITVGRSVVGGRRHRVGTGAFGSTRRGKGTL
jgi:hypothetical protein